MGESPAFVPLLAATGEEKNARAGGTGRECFRRRARWATGSMVCRKSLHLNMAGSTPSVSGHIEQNQASQRVNCL